MAKKVFLQFVYWHFLEMPSQIAKTWLRFLKFILRYFSVTFLLKTLFSPWRRYHYFYSKGFTLKENLEVFIFNAISRGLGAIARIFLISLGLASEISIVFLGSLTFLAWVTLPALLVLGLYFGLKIIF